MENSDYFESKEFEDRLEESRFDRTESELEDLSTFLKSKNADVIEQFREMRCSGMTRKKIVRIRVHGDAGARTQVAGETDRTGKAQPSRSGTIL